ncbi:hypothetical protein CC78DRAFT_432242, partial [Lojkania enalia]
ARTGAAAIDVSSGLTSVLDLRVRLEEAGDSTRTAGIPSVDEVLSMIAKRLDANQQIAYLMQSPRAWAMLKDGALVRSLDLDRGKIEEFAREVEGVIDQRLQRGKADLPPMTMNRIFETLEYNTITHPESREQFLELDDPAPEKLSREPATAAQIEEKEEELGIRLPKDYKEFLMVSNGFDAPFGGIIMEPSLFPVEKIRWLGDEEDYFTDLPLDIPADWTCLCHHSERPLEWPLVGKAIEIGTMDIDNIWLLPPANVDKVKQKVRSILDTNYSDEIKK